MIDTSIKENFPKLQLSKGNLKNFSGFLKAFIVQNKYRALDLITSLDPLDLSYDWPEVWFDRPLSTKCVPNELKSSVLILVPPL